MLSLLHAEYARSAAEAVGRHPRPRGRAGGDRPKGPPGRLRPAGARALAELALRLDRDAARRVAWRAR